MKKLTLLLTTFILANCSPIIESNQNSSISNQLQTKAVKILIKKEAPRIERIVQHTQNKNLDGFIMQYSHFQNRELINHSQKISRIQPIKLRLIFPELSETSVLFIVGHPLH